MDGTGILVVDECAVVTVDADGAEYEAGHLAVEGTRIVAGGVGPAPEEHARGTRRIAKRGCLTTPGLFDCHYLYQSPHVLADKIEEVAQ